MKTLLRIAAVVGVLWLGFVTVVYGWMRKPPEEFAAHMANLPMPAMLTVPFETLWSKARGGTLNIGDLAPDFYLESVDKKSRVRLSDYRGSKPVVLVFGSYT